MLICKYIQAHTSNRLLETRNGRYTHTHPIPTVDLTCTSTHVSCSGLLLAVPGFLPLHTETCSYVLGIGLMVTPHTRTLMPTLDSLYKHTCLLHAYKSVSLTCNQHHTQLAYLFHQCGGILLSRDDLIADCAVRHSGVEGPFSSLLLQHYCRQQYFNI